MEKKDLMDDDLINNDLIIIIMAGGLGTRMNSNTPKVLHKINNIPLIIHILNTSLILNPFKICVIVGKHKDLIESTINNYYNSNEITSNEITSNEITSNEITSKINYIIQNEPLGTGHAIMCCKNYLGKLNTNINNCLILSGDVPFIKAATLEQLFRTKFSANILVAYKNDPFGYGRIVFKNDKNDNETFSKIVEEKDCTQEEKKIQLINSGIYFFKIDILLKYIDKLTNNNNNKEYYLTQIFELLSKYEIGFTIVENLLEITGVNTEQQLNELEILSSNLAENSI